MRHLAPIVIAVLVSGVSHASAQSTDQVNLERELQSARDILYRLEARQDNLHPSLSEPLQQVADRLMQLGQYAEAHDALDRAMQIVRSNEGLYTRSQIPLLQRKIENLARWGNWPDARDQLEHIYWLYRTKIPVDAELVDYFMTLSDMHLRGVAGDSPEYQIFHLRRAETTNRWAILVGEAVWGEYDPRLSPILYSLVKQYHMQAAAVQGGGRVASELRQVAPGTSIMRDRISTRSFFYYAGLQALKRIRTIYREGPGAEPEAAAMAELYLADWQVLFGRDEEALASYQAAYKGLQEVGLDAAQLDRFFSKPTLVPELSFYPQLSLALDAREDVARSPIELASSAMSETLFFAEWSPAFPFVRPPFQIEFGAPVGSNVAMFSFNLAGISDIARWLSDRKKQGFASVQEATIVQPSVETSDQEAFLLERLETLRFRPRLDGGVPRDSAGTLIYQLAGEIPR